MYVVAQVVKNLPTMWETCVRSLGWEDPLEKAKATHSCILAWRIPWTIQSMGSQRAGRDWVTVTFTFHDCQESRCPCGFTECIMSPSAADLELRHVEDFFPTPSLMYNKLHLGFPSGSNGKEPASQHRKLWRYRFDPWVGEILCRRARQPNVNIPSISSILAWRIPMDRRVWQGTVHRVTKSWIRMKPLSMNCMYLVCSI